MKERGWREVPLGGVIPDAGNTRRYETGTWRTERPILDREKCTDCLICWIYCPDTAIIVEDGKMKGFNLYHCKGCGICMKECPPKIQAIKMVLESETEGEEAA